jgi:catechol 2,3-dioxygenase-like lactoylglutathione lyase family enzyme
MMVRRASVPLTIVLVLAVLWLAVAYTAAAPEIPPVVSAVDAIGITVASIDRSVAFYRDLFGFEIVSDREVTGESRGLDGGRARVVRLRLGDESVELVQWLHATGRPVPEDSRSNDRWFQHIAIIVSDMDQAHLWLLRHRVEPISPGPQRLPDWNPNAGGIRAFYFKDPDGHPLEILEFPPDKGDARWRRPSDRVFLGIDHTAIVVGDTDAALRFYRDALGLQVVGASENWGPEQERLNAVPGARLRITTLRASAGPGVELLEYLAPRDGRPAPSDARLTDLTHWHTILRADTARAARGLAPARAGTAHDRVPLRDPDGHAMELRSR